jgi:hypothetical protein
MYTDVVDEGWQLGKLVSLVGEVSFW